MSNLETNICTQCGAPLEEKASTCKFCGAEIMTTQSQKQEVSQPQFQQPVQPQYQQPIQPQYQQPVTIQYQTQAPVRFPQGSCTNCGGYPKKIGIKAWQILVSIFFFPIGLLALLVNNGYKCSKCGFEWK